jgi:putative transposase
MFAAEIFLSSIVKENSKDPVSTDGERTWYPSQACKFLNLEHYLHSAFEKSVIEMTIQYFKDRTESFDDYFPCKRKTYELKHIKNWLNQFVDYHNTEIMLK